MLLNAILQVCAKKKYLKHRLRPIDLKLFITKEKTVAIKWCVGGK